MYKRSGSSAPISLLEWSITDRRQLATFGFPLRTGYSPLRKLIKRGAVFSTLHINAAIALFSIVAVLSGQELPPSIWDPNMRIIAGRVVDGTGKGAQDVGVYMAAINAGCIISTRSTKTNTDGHFRFDQVRAYFTYLVSTDPELRLNLNDPNGKGQSVIQVQSADVSGIALMLRSQPSDVKVADCALANSAQSLRTCLAEAVRFHDSVVWQVFGGALLTTANSAKLNLLRGGQRTWEQDRKRECNVAASSATEKTETTDQMLINTYACQLRLDVIQEKKIAALP
jgi:uncharacterized protein YecT (DUF1311 family)